MLSCSSEDWLSYVLQLWFPSRVFRLWFDEPEDVLYGRKYGHSDK